MKLWIIVSLVLVLVVAGFVAVNALQDNKVVANAVVGATSCGSCNGSCTAEKNCGLSTCGAANGGSCTCGKTASCGGSCEVGGATCGSSSCAAAKGTGSCGCGK